MPPGLCLRVCHPNIVQRLIGHEDVTTTLGIYTDVPPDYIDRVDDVFREPDETDEP
jgi:site-specific recombinase XerD